MYSAAVLKEFNLCDSPSVARLVEWLLAEPTSLSQPSETNVSGGLICVTSYYAFALAFGHMTHEEKNTAVRNLHVRADESHHVAMGETKGEAGEKDKNKVGILFNLLMKTDDNSGITLSTATNFRGDDKCIIQSSHLGKFKRFRLPFNIHFMSLGIKTFNVGITETKTNPTDDIVQQVCAEKTEKHFVVIPPRNVGWRALEHNSSLQGFDTLVAKIKESWPTCRILDLVTESTQKANKKKLLAEPKNGETKESQYDVIITCMLGREGTDWVPASRLHVSYVEGSITLSVQTLGRILRKYKGKTKIVAQYYFPIFGETDGVTKAESKGTRINALLFMSQVDDMFFPIIFKETEETKKTEAGATSGTSEHVTLADLMGEQAYIDMVNDFFHQAVDDGISTEAACIKQIAEEVVTAHGVSLYLAERAVKVLLLKYLGRAKVQYQTVNMNFLDAHDFSELMGTLTPDQKTLVFHGCDPEHMAALRNAAMNKLEDNYANVLAYNLKEGDDPSEILPLDLYNFTRQMKRWLSEAQAAKVAGVSE